MAAVRSRVNPARVAQAKLEKEALQMAVAGVHYRDIAAHQGCSVSTAYGRVHKPLNEITLAPATELKQLMHEQISALLRALWPTAMRDGPQHVKAVNGCLRLLERLCKLHGLDAPVKIRREIVTGEDLEDALNEIKDSMSAFEAGEPMPVR